MIDGATSRSFLALVALVVSALAFLLITAWLCVTIGHPALRPTWLLVAWGGSALAAVVAWRATLKKGP